EEHAPAGGDEPAEEGDVVVDERGATARAELVVERLGVAQPPGEERGVRGHEPLARQQRPLLVVGVVGGEVPADRALVEPRRPRPGRIGASSCDSQSGRGTTSSSRNATTSPVASSRPRRRAAVAPATGSTTTRAATGSGGSAATAPLPLVSPGESRRVPARIA